MIHRTHASGLTAAFVLLCSMQLQADPPQRGREDSASLRRSFESIKKFADDAESPTEMESAPIAQPSASASASASASEVSKEPMPALVPRPPVQAEEESVWTIGLAKQLEYLKVTPLLDLPEMSFAVENGAAQKLFSGDDATQFAQRIYRMIQGMAVTGDFDKVRVIVTSDMLPEVHVELNMDAPSDLRLRIEQERKIEKSALSLVSKYYAVKISLGALAFAQNADELAALVAQAMARQNPQVWGFHDDPRLNRRLQEQINIVGLAPALQTQIKADVSALERIKSLGLRPWALTDYELRTFSFLRDVVAKKWWYGFSRDWAGLKADNPILTDEYYELRVIAQKITVGYMQERENISAQIQNVTPYDDILGRVHLRAHRALGSTFNVRKKIRNWGLTIGAVVAGVGYAASQRWGFNISWPSWLHFDTSAVPTEQVVPSVPFAPSAPSAPVIGSTVVPHEGLISRTWHAVTQTVFEWVVDPVISTASSASQSAWSAVSKFFAPAVQAVQTGAQGISQAAQWTGSQVAASFNATINGVGNGYTAVADGVAAAYSAVAEVVSRGANVAKSATVHVAQTVGEWVAIGWTHTASGFDFVWLHVKSGAIYVTDSVTQPIAEGARYIATHAVAGWHAGLEGVSHLYTVIDPTLTAVAPYAPGTAIAAATAGAVYYFRNGLKTIGLGAWDQATAMIYGVKTSMRNRASFRQEQNQIDEYLANTLSQTLSFSELEALFKDLILLYHNLGFGSLSAKDKFTQDLGPLRGFQIYEKRYWQIFKEELGVLIRHLKQNTLSVSEVTVLLKDWERRGNQHWFAAIHRRHGVHEEMIRLYSALVSNYVIPEKKPNLWADNAVFKTARYFAQIESLNTQFSIPTFLEHIQTVHPYASYIVTGLLKKHLYQLLTETFSPNTSHNQRLEVLTLISEQSKQGDRLRALADLRKVQKQFLREGSLGKALALEGFIVEGMRISPDNNRKATVLERAWRKIAKFNSIQEIIEYVRVEFTENGASTRPLAPILHRAIAQNTRLIASYQDALLVLATEDFWPEWQESYTTVGELEGFLVKVIQEKKMRHQRRWAYEPRMVEDLHRKIGLRLQQIGAHPKTFAELKDFWFHLTERGVTAESDRVLQRLIDLASGPDIQILKNAALNEGRVWETDLHSRLAIAQVKSETAYKRLLQEQRPAAREELLTKVISSLSSYIPERGIPYVQFLEDLSVQINSSYAEAQIISDAKTESLKDGGSGAADSNYRAVKIVFDGLREWSKYDQLNFLLFIRGVAEPTVKLQNAFRTVGLERVRRMYEILPIGARVGILDAFLTHTFVGSGVKENTAWIRRLTGAIIGGEETESQRISHQLLTAFLHAVSVVGNGNLTSTILSYLYALPSSATDSPGETLKHVLEVFGATGIKVGQFLLAAQILPPEESKVLRSLQDRAKIPSRMELYEDVMDILGIPQGAQLPFSVLELLGAASMKYAFLAQDNETFQKLVVKIFRLEAKNNVDMQFDVLENMSKYLVEKFGAKYGVLEVIIESARRAVDRERNTRHEIYKSQIARHAIYVRMNEQGIEVEAPQEDLIRDRMIVAQYAEGVSFNELPDKWKPVVARKILAMESEILFGDEPVIRFDPDRHAGNYLILVQENADLSSTIKISPIDFGQVLRISTKQRERVIRLFALAQIVSKAGMNEWLLEKVQDVMGLTPDQSVRLRQVAKKYVQASGFNPVTVYISLLAAIRASGHDNIDISYIDFIRGIIQLTQYESHTAFGITPSQMFEQQVFVYLEEYLKNMKLDPVQIKMIRVVNTYRDFKGFVTQSEQEHIPLDPSEMGFSEMIRRDDRCDGLLKKGA